MFYFPITCTPQRRTSAGLMKFEFPATIWSCTYRPVVLEGQNTAIRWPVEACPVKCPQNSICMLRMVSPTLIATSCNWLPKDEYVYMYIFNKQHFNKKLLSLVMSLTFFLSFYVWNCCAIRILSIPKTDHDKIIKRTAFI